MRRLPVSDMHLVCLRLSAWNAREWVACVDVTTLTRLGSSGMWLHDKGRWLAGDVELKSMEQFL